MSTQSDLVRSVRRRLGGEPQRSYILNNPLLAADTSIQLPSGHARYFPTEGNRLEFDDGTDEVAITTAAASSTDDTVEALLRGVDGSTAANHAANTVIFLDPRFPYAQVAETIDDIINNDLWPFVWLPLEATLTPDLTTQLYPAPAGGVTEAVYAYQVISGFGYPVQVELLASELVDDTLFPNGAIVIQPGALQDSSAVTVSFRARPTIANLDASLTALVVRGATADLLIAEESLTVATDAGFEQRRLGPGDRQRAGLVARQVFERQRLQKNVDLQAREAQRIRVLTQGL